MLTLVQVAARDACNSLQPGLAVRSVEVEELYGCVYFAKVIFVCGSHAEMDVRFGTQAGAHDAIANVTLFLGHGPIKIGDFGYRRQGNWLRLDAQLN
jgi:hypothetical protein